MSEMYSILHTNFNLKMKNKNIIYQTLLLTLFSISISYSQGVAINEEDKEANPSAILDISSNKKGVLIPRMTEVQRNAIASPAEGLMIYQTDGDKGFYYWTADLNWVAIGKNTLPKTSIVLSKIPNNSTIESGGFGYLGKASLNFSEVIGQETIPANSWSNMSNTGAPSNRVPMSVWTGTELIVYGGFDGNLIGDGAKYDPTCDAWTTISNTGVPPKSTSTVVWTGTEMIIWGGGDGNGGYTKDGYAYNPTTRLYKRIKKVPRIFVLVQHQKNEEYVTKTS
jgi:hypothetical protein